PLLGPAARRGGIGRDRVRARSEPRRLLRATRLPRAGARHPRRERRPPRHVACAATIGARGGAPIDHDEAAVAAHMALEHIDIEVALGVGEGEARTIGIDLGPGYIKENVKTS